MGLIFVTSMWVKECNNLAQSTIFRWNDHNEDMECPFMIEGNFNSLEVSRKIAVKLFIRRSHKLHNCCKFF